MVWENVPGAFSSNKGRDFQSVLTAIAEIAENGVPTVPMPGKGKWPKSGCLYDDMGSWSIAWRLHDARFWGVPQRRKRIALVADFRGLTAPEILFEREGVSWSIDKSGEERKETPDVIRSGTGRTISFQERAGCPGGGKGILIQDDRVGALSTVNNQYVFDARGNGDGKTVCNITGAHNNRVTDYTALCVGNGQLNQISMAEQANTLDTMHDQQAVLVSGFVRRLTPVECERLQGFPDSWTDIGDWTDSRGRKRKCSDTARYKALGNSIALPFWEWLLGRISEKCGDGATLGSLFDGIGGFPLCWELHNGVGSAIWASEIEEFPIAVTRYHFPDTEEKY